MHELAAIGADTRPDAEDDDRPGDDDDDWRRRFDPGTQEFESWRGRSPR